MTSETSVSHPDRSAVLRYAKVVAGSRFCANADRPGLGSDLAYACQDDGLIVWKGDHLGRSLPPLIETVTALTSRGVSLRSAMDAINAMMPRGRLVLHLLRMLDRFERNLMVERARAGLAAVMAPARADRRKNVDATIAYVRRSTAEQLPGIFALADNCYSIGIEDLLLIDCCPDAAALMQLGIAGDPVRYLPAPAGAESLALLRFARTQSRAQWLMLLDDTPGV